MTSGPNLQGNRRGIAIVAEDSSANAAALAIFIKQCGFEVLSFSDGLTAWNHVRMMTAAKAAELKIIFSDYMMPNMNGLELARQIRSLSHLQKVPFVFCSAIVDPKVVKEAKELSQGYIVKPATLTTVRNKIDALLGGAANPAQTKAS